ncbi:MAG TPA: hypothetical protein VEV45_20670 [Streptosporangiaceae bacterium]|nr:hypothetical protein [Streptosporangiaceae bacterium]
MSTATGFYELPTLVPATKESAGSSSPSLLPTCTTSNSHGNTVNNRGELLLPGVVSQLLPTPASFTQNGGDPHLTPGLAEHYRQHRGNLIEWAAAVLLPTPLARDHKGNNTPTGSPHHSRPGQRRGPGEAGLPQTLLRLLPTPRAVHGSNNWDGRERPGGEGPNLGTVARLLPTPEASDATGGRRPSSMDPHRASGAKRSFPLGAVVHLKLLRTPMANMGSNGGGQPASKRLAGGHSPSVEDQVMEMALLPTPLTGEARHGSPNQHRSRGDTMLTGAVIQLVDGQHLDQAPTRAAKLMSTPRASDGGWEGEAGTHKGQRASSAGWGLRNETRSLVSPPGQTSTAGAPMSPDASTP